MIVHLVRHAERAETGGRDPGLSPRGVEQARRLGAQLAIAGVGGVAGVAGIHSSPLRRALETAEVLARDLGVEILASPLLRERANFGDLAGQTRADFDREWVRCSAERDRVPAGGDSSREAGARIARFLAGLAAETVVAVTHGGVLADFLRNVCDEEVLRSSNPAFAAAPYAASSVPECSVTTLVWPELEVLGIARPGGDRVG